MAKLKFLYDAIHFNYFLLSPFLLLIMQVCNLIPYFFHLFSIGNAYTLLLFKSLLSSTACAGFSSE